MASIDRPPLWDDEHTEPVKILAQLSEDFLPNGPEFMYTFRVCKTCRSSRELCGFAWRREVPRD